MREEEEEEVNKIKEVMMSQWHLPTKSTIIIGSSLYPLFLLTFFSTEGSFRRNAATYGVNIAVYITSNKIIQSHTA
jgi:hypothetical protein